MEARASATQAALNTAAYNSVGRPGSSINNTGTETWVQIQINFARDFPAYSTVGTTGAYVSGSGNAYPYRAISQPTISQYSINNGSDLLTLQDNGLNVFRVSSQGNIYSSQNGGFYSGGADLAENYTSIEALAPGDVVQIDPVDNQSIKKSTGQYQSSLLGVVSTAPGFVAGAFTETSHPVALVGRVPVKVSTENGPIHEGDFLTSASIAGYAMRATTSGRVLGTTLESFDPSKATPCPADGAGAVTANKCGTVMMFVNLTDYQGASVDALMAEDQQGQIVGDAIIPNIDFPDIDGIVGAKQENILSFLKTLKTKQANGQAAKGGDILTNRLSAVDEVISPLIVADIIRAKTIQASKIEGLEVYTNSVKSLSDVVSGLQTQKTSAPAAAVDFSHVQFGAAQFNLNILVLGTIEAKGGLIVDGESQFNGKSTFNNLAIFMRDVTLQGNLNAQGRVTFNNDAGGSAVIKKNGTRVDVAYAKEYDLAPIVAASLTADQTILPNGTKEDLKVKEQRLLTAGYSYLVSNVTTKGFTIVLNKKATEDLQFNWSAIAIKDPNQTLGLTDSVDTTATPPAAPTTTP